MPDTPTFPPRLPEAGRRARGDVRPRAAIRRGAESREASGKSVDPDDVGGFIAIDAKGMVTLYSGKVELGTGALTAITQIAAEELSVPFARVTTIQGDTAADAEPGADVCQPLDPGRRHADPARGGDRARGVAQTRRRASSVLRRPSSSCATASSRPATAARQLSYARARRRSEARRSRWIPRRR